MGNLDERTTETIFCRKCGKENEVDVLTVYDNTNNSEDYSVELAEYTECTECCYIFTDMDLPL